MRNSGIAIIEDLFEPCWNILISSVNATDWIHFQNLTFGFLDMY